MPQHIGLSFCSGALCLAQFMSLWARKMFRPRTDGGRVAISRYWMGYVQEVFRHEIPCEWSGRGTKPILYCRALINHTAAKQCRGRYVCARTGTTHEFTTSRVPRQNYDPWLQCDCFGKTLPKRDRRRPSANAYKSQATLRLRRA